MIWKDGNNASQKSQSVKYAWRSPSGSLFSLRADWTVPLIIAPVTKSFDSHEQASLNSANDHFLPNGAEFKIDRAPNLKPFFAYFREFQA